MITSFGEIYLRVALKFSNERAGQELFLPFSFLVLGSIEVILIPFVANPRDPVFRTPHFARLHSIGRSIGVVALHS